MCDTLCAVGSDGSWFAKNSDRPPAEPQVVEALPPRVGGGVVRTQYLELEDTGSCRVLGSRPTWLWGLEHGVNEHGVAIGNERVWTTVPVEQPALLGMDLVRLGLERGASADAAVEVMIDLLERHGQGGVGDASTGDSYSSSFLVVDRAQGWILETARRSWAARRVAGTAALSNRISLGTDWDRASPDVEAAGSFDLWRDPAAPTGHADKRLASSTACLATSLSLPALAAHLRDHGGSDLMPERARPDGTGVTVCMHLRTAATTASMIVSMHDRVRVWVSLGSPCASLFVPVQGPEAAPAFVADAQVWQRFAGLARAVEREPGRLPAIRERFSSLETELWAEADAVEDWAGFARDAERRVLGALREVECASAA